jgi:hypothetical protein
MKKEYKDLTMDEKKEFELIKQTFEGSWILGIFLPSIVLLQLDAPKWYVLMFIIGMMIMFFIHNNKMKKNCFGI